MWFGDDEEAARLEAEGHERLEAGDLGGAHERGKALIAMGWSGGFVLEALAFRGAGEVGRAVVGLEEAVTRAPGAWRLWQLLGNLRSDEADHDGAVEAYGRALGCEGVSQVVVHLNRAIAHRRADRFGDALADLDPILALPRPPLAVAETALALTLECLAALGRADDALGLIESALETCAEDDPRRPRLHAEHALALDRAKADADAIEGAFENATQAGVATLALLALGRRLRPVEMNEPAQRLQLVAQGEPPDGTDAAGFLRVFDVVAEGPAQALELVRSYVPAAARPGLRVERCDVREAETTLEAGVHGASDIMLFT